MKDPKVEKLVAKFKEQIAEINKTWASLQEEGMYIDIRAEGSHNYTDKKYFAITRMTQSVEYLKEK